MPVATAPPAADVHPLDMIARARVKIIALNLLITSEPGSEALVMGNNMREGLYFSLLSITDELDLALNKLQEERQNG